MHENPDIKKGHVIPFPMGRRLSTGPTKEYTLRVYLIRGPYGEEAVGQEIYRTLRVRGDQTLEDLHHGIFCSYERKQDRYYEFCIGNDPSDPTGIRYICGEEGREHGLGSYGRSGGDRIGLAPLATLESLGLAENQFFGYWFDLFEEWIHLILVLSIEPADASEDYPVLVEKSGKLPVPAPTQGESREDGREIDRLSEEEFLILLIGGLQMRWRQQVENTPLKPQTRLETALTKLPSHWLEAICNEVGLGRAGNRKKRIEMLVDWLPRGESLERIWNSLPLPSREVLSWIVLEKRGWAKIQQLSRRYGVDPDITWWWNEGQVPETPLGLLRLNGVVYVGRRLEGRRRVRIATIPVELRKGLARIVQDARSKEAGASSAASGKRRLSLVSSSRGGPFQIPKPEVVHADCWKGLDAFNLRSFLSICPLREDTEGLYAHTLGRIRKNPEDFPRRHVREFLKRMVQGSSVWSRLAAYKLGLTVLDERFVEAALTDRSRTIQKWAQGVLENPQESLF